ncbi:MAG: hypothetical protein ACOCVH_02690, partial [Verrucomicrobiota bacterium]
MTAGMYLTHVRGWARGGKRLRGGDHNISEAAWAAGFKDSNYFSPYKEQLNHECTPVCVRTRT